MSRTLRLVANDTAPDFTVTLRDRDSNAMIDLSDVTSAQAKLRLAGSTTVLDTLTGTVELPATNGQLTFTLNPTTLQNREAGLYELEIALTLTGGKLQTLFDVLPVQIRSDF